ASGLPDGLSIDSNTGVISGLLADNSVGTHTVTITASDGDQPGSNSFTWVVYPPLTVTASASPSSVEPGVPIEFTASASGGSGSGYSYPWDFGAMGPDVINSYTEGDSSFNDSAAT